MFVAGNVVLTALVWASQRAVLDVVGVLPSVVYLIVARTTSLATELCKVIEFVSIRYRRPAVIGMSSIRSTPTSVVVVLELLVRIPMAFRTAAVSWVSRRVSWSF